MVNHGLLKLESSCFRLPWLKLTKREEVGKGYSPVQQQAKGDLSPYLRSIV